MALSRTRQKAVIEFASGKPRFDVSAISLHVQKRMAAKGKWFADLSPFIKDGVLGLDWEDEVLAGACLTHAGEIRHAGVKAALGL